MADDAQQSVTRIFESFANDKVPMERRSWNRTIGEEHKKLYWRPNNYRRALKVREGLSEDYPVLRGDCPYALEMKQNTRNGSWSVKGYPNVTLQIFPKTIMGCWRQMRRGKKKMTYCIEYDSEESLKAWLIKKAAEIEHVIDEAMFDFARRTGRLKEGALPAWSHFEDWVRDPEIAKVPDDFVVYDSFFKKVYDEGVEFVPSERGERPAARLSAYLRSAAFDDKAERVLRELVKLRADNDRQLREIREELAKTVHRGHRVSHPSQKKLGGWF